MYISDFNKLFLKFQCGFQISFNTQHCLITMIEKCQRSFDGGGQVGALPTDFPKSYFIDHELLIAKLYVYDFDKNVLYVINSYLKGRKQRTKINSSYSTFPEILFGVSEASILRSLLFNIYIVNLLFENSDDDIANYADDNPPYTCLSESDFVIFKLQKNIERIFRWFHNNNLISKAEKCDLIVSFKENLQIKDPSCSA